MFTNERRVVAIMLFATLVRLSAPRAVAAQTVRPSPTPYCRGIHTNADLVKRAAAVFPNVAHTRPATIELSVGVAPNGSAKGESIVYSSGNKQIDAAAVKAARDSAYLPAEIDCTGVDGTYDFFVRYPGTYARCANPDEEGSVVRVAPIRNPSNVSLIVPSHAVVDVIVGPDGRAMRETIYKSSGNVAFDRAALVAARMSVYAPVLHDCRPVTGHVMFTSSYKVPTNDAPRR